MTEFQKDIISLIKSSLSGTEAIVSDNLNFDYVYNFAKMHQTVAILYYALANNERFNSSEVSKQFFSDTCMLVTKSENQRIENENIFTAFDKNGIEYMPVKGSVIKDIYPYPEMRMMGDSDILIKPEKMKLINSVMESIGFGFYAEGECERCFKKDEVINIELHKMLFEPRQKDLYACFGDGWKNAVKSKRGSMYELSHEDNYIYLFLHFTKHYRNGGVGIKHVTDLMIYKKTYSLNMEYIEKKIESLGLGKFYRNTEKVLSVWFEDEKPDDVTDFMTDFIFSSGTFGNIQNQALSNAVKEASNGESISKTKKGRTITLIFPKYKNMKILYPVLEKAPFLLPFMWVVRIFSRLIFKSGKVKQEMNKLKTSNKVITDENVEKYREGLELVGLNFEFDFKE